MSTSLRKIKGKRKAKSQSLTKLLQDESKRVRLVFLVCGIVLVGVGLILSGSRKQNLSSVPSYQKQTSASAAALQGVEPIRASDAFLGQKTLEAKNAPLRIVIPVLSIDIPVEEAKIVKGYWEVFSDRAGFGSGSAYPGEKGNQVIFAHARSGLFLPLRQAKTGQVVYVTTDDKLYTYKITDVREVSPSQVAVVGPTTDTTLTLFTCSGFADSKRLIVTAKPSS